MRLPNKDEVKGKYDAVLGTVREKVGHAIEDKEMEREGAAEHDAGEVRQQVGKLKRQIGETIEDIGKFVRK